MRGTMVTDVPTVPPRTAKYARLAGYLVEAWQPWHGKPRIPDLLCGLGILVSVVYSLAMIALTPSLIASHPLLLDMLSGSNPAVMAAGSFSAVQVKLPLAVVMIVALPGMLKFDWVFWWAGRRWGLQVAERLGNRSPRSAAMVAMVERRGTRFARSAVLLSPFLPLPTGVAYAVAGWADLPLIPFLTLDVAGRALSAALLGACGYLLGPWGVAVAELIARYALVTLGLLAVIAVAPQLWHALRRRVRNDNHREVTNRRPGSLAYIPATPRHQRSAYTPITLAAMRSRGGVIYIVAHEAKMVDHRDGSPVADP